MDEVRAALPDYEVGAMLGRGGFGLVFDGCHREIRDRRVAIKVLLHSGNDDEQARFRREAEALARFDHPHIAKLYDYRSRPQNGLFLLVMEHLSGGMLRDRHRDGLSPQAVCAVGIAVAEALHYAHGKGRLHRDIAPDNIIFSGDGIPKVTDFGIVKEVEGAFGHADYGIGKPGFMAPEQFGPGEVGPGTDVYALGATLYFLFSGRMPFDPKVGRFDLWRAQVETVPAPPSTLEPVARVVLRALRPDIADRHHSAHDFALDLAKAGGEVFGPGWFDRCGIPIWVQGDIRDAAQPDDPLPPTHRFGEDLPMLYEREERETLRGADLSGLKLSGADLTHRNLTGARLVHTDLTDADLRDAILVDAVFDNVSLKGANLTGADLSGARLFHTDLTGVSLRGSRFDRAALLSCTVDPHTLVRPELADAAISGRDRVEVVIRRAGGFGGLAFSPDGGLLACSAMSGVARLWDVRTGREIRQFTGHTELVHSVAFSPDGLLLATSGGDNTVRLWGVATGHQIRLFTGHSLVVFSSDGRFLAACKAEDLYDSDGRLCGTNINGGMVGLWDVATGQEIRRLAGHDSVVQSMAFSPDGRLLATSSGDGGVTLWNVATGEEVRSFFGTTDIASSVAFSPDGLTLAIGGWGVVRLVDLATGQQTCTRIGKGSPSPVVFSPDAQLFAECSVGAGPLRLWDVATGREIHQFADGTDSVWSAAFSPDGRLLAGSTMSGTVQFWDVATGREIRQLTDAPTSDVKALAFSPDSQLLAIGSSTGAVRLRDVATGREIRQFTGESTDSVELLVFSSDSQLLATSRFDGIVRLREMATGREIRQIAGHSDRVRSAAFSPDGALIATGSLDRTARLWHVPTGSEIRQFTGHTAGLETVVFSADGRFLATGAGSEVWVWEVATSRKVSQITGRRNTRSLVFSPNGRLLAWNEGIGKVQLWDVTTGREIHHFACPNSVWSVAFSPDGRLLAIGDSTGTVWLWDVTTAQEAYRLAGHAGRMPSVAFSPDGCYLAVGGDDGPVSLWDATTGRLQHFLISFPAGWGVLVPDGSYKLSGDSHDAFW